MIAACKSEKRNRIVLWVKNLLPTKRQRMCSLSCLESTERRIRLWSNITCVTYFLLIGLVTYRLYSFVMVSESRSPILLSIYTLPFVFVYCLVEIKLNVGCIFWTSSTELHNKLITQLIRWLIMVHDFVYLCLISVSVIFCYSSFCWNYCNLVSV